MWAGHASASAIFLEQLEHPAVQRVAVESLIDDAGDDQQPGRQRSGKMLQPDPLMRVR